jgi:hypothetical protein
VLEARHVAQGKHLQPAARRLRPSQRRRASCCGLLRPGAKHVQCSVLAVLAPTLAAKPVIACALRWWPRAGDLASAAARPSVRYTGAALLLRPVGKSRQPSAAAAAGQLHGACAALLERHRQQGLSAAAWMAHLG